MAGLKHNALARNGHREAKGPGTHKNRLRVTALLFVSLFALVGCPSPNEGSGGAPKHSSRFENIGPEPPAPAPPPPTPDQVIVPDYLQED